MILLRKHHEILPGGEKKNAKDEVEDDEFARIMSKLKELEMEEEHDGKDRGEEEPIEIVEESEHNTEQETTTYVPKKVSGHSSSIRELRYSEPRVKGKVMEVLPDKHQLKDLDDSLRLLLWMNSHYFVMSIISSKSDLKI